MNTNSMEKLLTIKQAREILNVSDATIRRKLKAGDIKIIRLGEAIVRIRESDLQDYIKSCEEKEPARVLKVV